MMRVVTKPLLAILVVLILLGGVLPGRGGALSSKKSPFGSPPCFDLNDRAVDPTAVVTSRPLKAAVIARFLAAAGFVQNFSGGPLAIHFGRCGAFSRGPAFVNHSPTLLTLGCLLTI